MPGRRRRGRREARRVRGAASALRRRRVHCGRPGYRSSRCRQRPGRADMLSTVWRSGSSPLIISQPVFRLTATVARSTFLSLSPFSPLIVLGLVVDNPITSPRFRLPFLRAPPPGAPGSVATRRSITSSTFFSSYYLVYRFTPPFWLDSSGSTLALSWSFPLATFSLRIPLATLQLLQLDRSSHSSSCVLICERIMVPCGGLLGDASDRSSRVAILLTIPETASKRTVVCRIVDLAVRTFFSHARKVSEW